jgi:hypothetical protein
MFIFDIMPYIFLEYVLYSLVIVGSIAFLISDRTGINPYIIKPLSAILVVGSIFLLGMNYSNKHHSVEVAKFREQIRIAEEKSNKTNIEIQTKIIEKIKIVKETTDANIQYIDRIITQYDDLCALSNAAVSVHNGASQNEISRSAGNSDEGTSDVKASDIIRTVTENYGTYYEVREQLLGWQRWYREQRKIYDTIK